MKTKPIEKPERPADDDCCGGGCSPCVWDFYHDQLARWLDQQNKPQPVLKQDGDEQLYR
ncbi:hypothetical protein EOPP23_00975 [Endozoicomonas sp. OPT23]|uniref:oxidoreductase-like domain-containing protein n=1 Tax=Endozoicomonas sp. OPT23 TaxID=2072845 RepID=UPI00129BD403|nr:oxidoreductase-like domain-containing protein [Endozoicomonas sp. OPT23]MRI31564.1 hypothetical protein [Endozoicomonas sp. OPT23]